MVLYVDDARRHSGAFQRPSCLQELPSFIVRQRCIRHAVKAVSAELDQIAETMRSRSDDLGHAIAADLVKQPVEVLPHVARYPVADGPRILARVGDALHNGVWILLPEPQEIQHRIRGGSLVQREKAFVFPGDDDQRIPAQPIRLIGLLEHHVVVHVQNSRRALRALHVARDPE